MLDVKHHERIDRRTVLLSAATALAASSGFGEEPVEASEPDSKPEATEQQIRDYLRPLLLTREDVELWLKRQAFPFAKYDPELGYLHGDRDFQWMGRCAGIATTSSTRGRCSLMPTSRAASTVMATAIRTASRSATARPGRSHWQRTWVSRCEIS
ncbi:MAG: hypothetical protein AB7K24_28405 [Gemmataceae bacterium]